MSNPYYDAENVERFGNQDSDLESTKRTLEHLPKEGFDFIEIKEAPKSGALTVRDFESHKTVEVDSVGDLRTLFYQTGIYNLYLRKVIAESEGVDLDVNRPGVLVKWQVIELLEKRQAQVQAAAKQERREFWRIRAKRLCGVAAVAGAVFISGVLASTNKPGDTLNPQSITHTSEAPSPKSEPALLLKPQDYLNLMPTKQAEVSSGQVPVKPKEIPEHPTNEAKPTIQPDLEAPSLWAMFARVVGEANATKEITRRARVLESMGYVVVYFGNPESKNKSHKWWVAAIIGPNGQKFESDRQVATLLTSAG